MSNLSELTTASVVVVVVATSRIRSLTLVNHDCAQQQIYILLLHAQSIVHLIVVVCSIEFDSSL